MTQKMGSVQIYKDMYGLNPAENVATCLGVRSRGLKSFVSRWQCCSTAGCHLALSKVLSEKKIPILQTKNFC